MHHVSKLLHQVGVGTCCISDIQFNIISMLTTSQSSLKRLVI